MESINFNINNEIDVLKITLEAFEVSDKAYSFFEEKDNSLCLNFFNNTWITYYKAYNKRSNFKKYNTFDDTCKYIFETFASDEIELKKMKRFFHVLGIQLDNANVEIEKAEDIVVSNIIDQRKR